MTVDAHVHTLYVQCNSLHVWSSFTIIIYGNIEVFHLAVAHITSMYMYMYLLLFVVCISDVWMLLCCMCYTYTVGSGESSKIKSLSELFKPPFDIMFQGSFQEVQYKII